MTKHIWINKLAAGASLAALMTAASPVWAQDDAVAVSLEEIQVTAQRREQSLQSVPVAVSAFTETEMARRQMGEALDILRGVPNLIGSNNTGLGTANTYFLRGIGQDESIATTDIPVGTYVDDVFIARQSGNNFSFLEVERVEVLRGPQGTLYGRNTTGGAVKIITKRPSQEAYAKASIYYGNYNKIEASGVVNVPLTDTAALKASVYVTDDEGTTENITTGEKFNNNDSYGGRLAVRLQPSESVDWLVSGDFSNTSAPVFGSGVANSTADDLFVIQSGLSKSDDCGNGSVFDLVPLGCGGQNKVENMGLASNFTWSGDDISVTSITAYRDMKHTFAIDFLDNTLGGFVIANIGNHKQFSQEFKANGTAADGALNYVAGAFYMKEDNFTEFADYFFGGQLNFREMENDTKSVALYAQADYDITDKLNAGAGIRWTHEEKIINIDFTSAFGPAGSFSNADLVANGYGVDQTAKVWTPKFFVEYQVSEDAMVYVSATKGFKSGGWNGRATSAITYNDFGPEFVWSYEVGLKSQWLDDRLRVNILAFQADYTDLQLTTVAPGTTVFITENAGDSRIKGIEIEIQAQPTEALNIYANLGTMDDEYSSLTDRALMAGLSLDTGIKRTPSYQWQAGFSYTAPLEGVGNIVIAADVSYVDKHNMGGLDDLATDIEERTLFNVGIALNSDDERWSVALECKNCSDERYHHSFLFGVNYPADPRRYGVRLGYNF